MHLLLRQGFGGQAFLFLSFLLLLSANATAQCYQTFLDDGKTFMRQGKWDQAIKAFETGKGCQADKPANGDATLNTLIGEARQKKQAATERKKQQVVEAQQREQEFARQREQDRQRREAANREDDGAWDIAQSAQNAAACQRYLDKYPTGRHTAEAQQCVKDYSDPIVLVQGGTFAMGSTEGDSDEKPVHSVTVSSFYLSKYEVTVKEYLQFVKETGGNAPEWQEAGNSYNINTGSRDHYKKMGSALTADQNPIVGISWNDANAYCQWLSKKTGRQYRLPTEAEWEYAAGGGDPNTADRTQWAGTAAESELRRYANYSDTGGSDTYTYTAPVGSFQPNRLGLYDLSGNVWEWCSDRKGTYPSSSQTNPTGPTEGAIRVLRGGSWGYAAPGCRAADRNDFEPTTRDGNFGFRVAASFQ